MKKSVTLISAALLMAVSSFSTPAVAQIGPKTLILYDAPQGTQFSKLGTESC